jgi:proton-dependent oligopeptide transporter, POT family
MLILTSIFIGRETMPDSSIIPSFAAAPAGRLFGHPKGIFLVALTEMWERFSYYGMAGLLVFFLIDDIGSGGFGWEKSDALKLYGLYTGLVFASPAIGGWISSTYWGERRSIMVGGLLVTLGHFLLAGPSLFPPMLEAWSGLPLEIIIAGSKVTLGQWSLDAAEKTQLLSHAAQIAGSSPNMEAWVIAAYRVISFSFLAGLALIVIGTGFIKATVSSIVGKLYSDDDPKREAGFTIFMVGIWFGSLSSNFIVGSIGNAYGWPAGLSAAGVGMAVGMLAYIFYQKRLLADIGRLPDKVAAKTENGAKTKLLRLDINRLIAIGIMSIFTVIYAVSFYQKGGLINLMIQERADRMIGGFEIPAPWFLSISTATFILFAPMLTGIIARLEARGWRIDVVRKQACGLCLLGAGYVFMTIAASHGEGLKISPIWFFCGYILFGIAEALIWPPQIAVATKLAPVHLKSFVVGCWFIATGMGTFLSGYIASLGEDIGVTNLFTGILFTCVAGAMLLLLLRPFLIRLMNDQTA